MTFTVRDATEDDVFKLVEIVRRVLLESPTYRHMAFDARKTANYALDPINKVPGYFLRIIVDENDDPVGGMICYCAETAFGPDKQAFDVTIMVTEECRGKCIKQLFQIMKEYKEWALAEGALIVKMGVSSGLNMDGTSNFFERAGFKRIGAMHAHVVGE